MSAIDGAEPLYLLPDRFEVAEFNLVERDHVLGESADRELSKINFNWMGAFLVEQAGLYESEVAEWFKSRATGLSNRKPLDVWRELDGFAKVFDYAVDYKAKVDEALSEEPTNIDPILVRSHHIANSALEIIDKAFEVAGVELTPTDDPLRDTDGDVLIANPNKPMAPQVAWRHNPGFDQWRIIFDNDNRLLMYAIGRHLEPGHPPLIVTTGIYESSRDGSGPIRHDTDLDSRPPSAGEVAKFVVPLANEVKNRSLTVVSA